MPPPEFYESPRPVNPLHDLTMRPQVARWVHALVRKYQENEALHNPSIRFVHIPSAAHILTFMEVDATMLSDTRCLLTISGTLTTGLNETHHITRFSEHVDLDTVPPNVTYSETGPSAPAGQVVDQMFAQQTLDEVPVRLSAGPPAPDRRINQVVLITSALAATVLTAALASGFSFGDFAERIRKNFEPPATKAPLNPRPSAHPELQKEKHAAWRRSPD